MCTVRLIVSSHQFQTFVQTVFHVLDPGTKLVCHNLHEQSRADFLVRTSVHQAQLSVSFETVVPSFRAPFCVSIERKYNGVANCCSCGGIAITAVADCLAAFSRAGYAGSSVPAYPWNVKVPVAKVFAICVRLWLPDSHVLWTRLRYRLSHCPHSFCESCHCRIIAPSVDCCVTSSICALSSSGCLRSNSTS